MEACENKTGNVFLHRNYRLVFFGALVSELGAVLYSFAVGFYLLEISDNNAVLPRVSFKFALFGSSAKRSASAP